MKFCDLSKRFCFKFDILDKEPKYLINNRMIHSNDNRTLAELNINNGMRIEVLD